MSPLSAKIIMSIAAPTMNLFFENAILLNFIFPRITPVSNWSNAGMRSFIGMAKEKGCSSRESLLRLAVKTSPNRPANRFTAALKSEPNEKDLHTEI